MSTADEVPHHFAELRSELRHVCKDGREVIVDSRMQLLGDNAVLEVNRECAGRPARSRGCESLTMKVFQRVIKIPPDHVARANAHGSASYDAWSRARPANDFSAMVPYLERTLHQSREYSSYFAPYKHVADPHIDYADEGLTTASIRKLFRKLKSQLVAMVCAILDQPVVDDGCLRQSFPKTAQTEFALHVAQRLGYDLNRGRLDLTHHPFSTRLSADDLGSCMRSRDVLIKIKSNGRRVSAHWFAGVLQSLCSSS